MPGALRIVVGLILLHRLHRKHATNDTFHGGAPIKVLAPDSKSIAVAGLRTVPREKGDADTRQHEIGKLQESLFEDRQAGEPGSD